MAEQRISDADAERSIAALLEVFRGPAERGELAEIIGQDGVTAYKRLAEYLVPALVRWQVGEVNRGTSTADRTLALAAFCGWMMANDARNADPNQDFATETSGSAFDLLIGMAAVYGRLVAEEAGIVPDTMMSRSEPRTS